MGPRPRVDGQSSVSSTKIAECVPQPTPGQPVFADCPRPSGSGPRSGKAYVRPGFVTSEPQKGSLRAGNPHPALRSPRAPEEAVNTRATTVASAQRSRSSWLERADTSTSTPRGNRLSELNRLSERNRLSKPGIPTRSREAVSAPPGWGAMSGSPRQPLPHAGRSGAWRSLRNCHSYDGLDPFTRDRHGGRAGGRACRQNPSLSRNDRRVTAHLGDKPPGQRVPFSVE